MCVFPGDKQFSAYAGHALYQSATSLKFPGLLGEIAAIAGPDAALAVAAAKGGVRVHFPPKPGPDHWLTKTVGQAAAQAICATIVPAKAGLELMVPLGPTGSRAGRWREISRLLDANMSVPQIARRLGIHERTVYLHKSGRLTRVKTSLAQIELFGEGF